MNLLEQKLRAIYDADKISAPFNNDVFELFLEFINNTINESRFLNPYIFSDDYNIDIDTSLALFLFFTNSSEPVLKIVPTIECFNSNCKDILFLEPTEQYILCEECDKSYDITQYRRYLKFLFEINPILYSKYKMASKTSSYTKIKSVPNGLKHSPPSSTFEISEKELEGGVSYKELNRINDTPTGPISDPYSEIQKNISKSMAKAK